MSVQRIASRYAKSLIELASERGTLDKTLSDLQSFEEVAKNKDFSNMLKSPIIKGDKKKSVFNAIFGDELDELTNVFFDVVLRKGREAYLPAIAKEFHLQYKIMNHVSSVKLITASKLTDDGLAALRKSILASEATDTNVELEVEVDESLIGGFIIEFDNKRYDSSVAHKLALLKKEFEQNQYTKEF
jgi:F-type H+-transporting ATPase subunit delta